MCVCVCVCARACSKAQSCLTLCDHVDCSPPGSSVRGILQAKVLEWAAISSSRGSSLHLLHLLAGSLLIHLGSLMECEGPLMTQTDLPIFQVPFEEAFEDMIRFPCTLMCQRTISRQEFIVKITQHMYEDESIPWTKESKMSRSGYYLKCVHTSATNKGPLRIK